MMSVLLKFDQNGNLFFDSNRVKPLRVYAWRYYFLSQFQMYTLCGFVIVIIRLINSGRFFNANLSLAFI